MFLDSSPQKEACSFTTTASRLAAPESHLQTVGVCKRRRKLMCPRAFTTRAKSHRPMHTDNSATACHSIRSLREQLYSEKRSVYLNTFHNLFKAILMMQQDGFKLLTASTSQSPLSPVIFVIVSFSLNSLSHSTLQCFRYILSYTLVNGITLAVMRRGSVSPQL